MGKLNRSTRIKLLEEAKAIATLEHNYEKALRKIAVVLNDNPNDIDALILKGNILDLDEEYEKSLKCYEKVVAIDKNNVRALIDMGDWYSKQGNVEEALTFYDRALTLLKQNIYYLSKEEELNEAYIGKILLLREQGRIDEAREIVADAIVNCPGFEAPNLEI